MSGEWGYVLNFLAYLGVSAPLLILGVVLFVLTTPYHEFRILAEGAELEDQRKIAAAKAVAFDLGGKVIGQALVLGSAVYHAVGLWDMVIWGIIGIVALIVVYWVFEFLTPWFKVRVEIPKGNVAVGGFSFCLSVATGLLMAALISY